MGVVVLLVLVPPKTHQTRLVYWNVMMNVVMRVVVNNVVHRMVVLVLLWGGSNNRMIIIIRVEVEIQRLLISLEKLLSSSYKPLFLCLFLSLTLTLLLPFFNY